MQNARLDKGKLESRLPGEISITSDMQMTPSLWQKAKKNVKEESLKAGLKLNIQKPKIMAFSFITSWQIDGGNNGNSDKIFSWAPKSLWTVTSAMKLKDTCSLEGKL